MTNGNCTNSSNRKNGHCGSSAAAAVDAAYKDKNSPNNTPQRLTITAREVVVLERRIIQQRRCTTTTEPGQCALCVLVPASRQPLWVAVVDGTEKMSQKMEKIDLLEISLISIRESKTPLDACAACTILHTLCARVSGVCKYIDTLSHHCTRVYTFAQRGLRQHTRAKERVCQLVESFWCECGATRNNKHTALWVGRLHTYTHSKL
jgi:hypothetical protein